MTYDPNHEARIVGVVERYCKLLVKLDLMSEDKHLYRPWMLYMDSVRLARLSVEYGMRLKTRDDYRVTLKLLKLMSRLGVRIEPWEVNGVGQGTVGIIVLKK